MAHSVMELRLPSWRDLNGEDTTRWPSRSPEFREQCKMPEAASPYSVEERVVQGETMWVAIRARGAEWSWLTPAEAVRLGRQWIERYGDRHKEHVAGD
jgi:hypothetical protein